MPKSTVIIVKKFERVGSLTVLDSGNCRYRLVSSITGKDFYTTARKCRCDCGNIVYVYNNNLVNRPKTACRECYNRNRIKATLVNVVNYTRRQIKSRDHEFIVALTDEQIIDLIKSDCFYCGMPPNNNYRGKGIVFYNGIDRLNSKKPYTFLNTVPCCKVCNFMKQRHGLSEFLDKIKMIYENLALENLPELKEVA